jgi:hypothetical protein
MRPLLRICPIVGDEADEATSLRGDLLPVRTICTYLKGAPAARQRRASARAGIVSRETRNAEEWGVRRGGGDHQTQGLTG